jgi:hypothetical protein
VKSRTDIPVCPSVSLFAPGRLFPSLLRYFFTSLLQLFHAAPIALRCWKHSRQKTGRPCVGRKGTVVSFPHCEQFVFVSERIGEACPPPPPPSARFALQALQRLGSFLNPLSAKNICSPPVNTNSAPHSAHFNTLSWYSMSRSPLVPVGQEIGRTLYLRAGLLEETCIRGRRARIPWACGHEAETRTQTSLPYRGLILGSAAPSRVENGVAAPTWPGPPF